MRIFSITAQLFLLIYLDEVNNEDNEYFEIISVGNDIIPSNKGINVPGNTFLLDDVIPHDGVIVAFTSYFRNKNKIQFQIWREAASLTSSFELINGAIVTPNQQNQEEKVTWQQFEVVNGTCLTVTSGDRLGVFIAESPSSVTYEWDFNNALVLMHSVNKPEDVLQVGDVVTFDSLSFPFHFSFKANINIGYTKGNGTYTPPSCEEALVLEYATTSTTTDPDSMEDVTLPVGPPGPPGPPGPKGEAGPRGSRGEKGDSGNNGKDGISGPMGQAGNPGTNGVKGEPGVKGQNGGPGPRGDPGLKGDPGTLNTHLFMEYVRNISETQNGGNRAPGDFITGTKGQKGDRGTPGTNGQKGTGGVKGPRGTKGTKGERGFTGSKGARGLSGRRGPPGEVVNISRDDPDLGASLMSSDSDFMISRTVIVAIISWQAVLTFSFILVCILFLLKTRRGRKVTCVDNATDNLIRTKDAFKEIPRLKNVKGSKYKTNINWTTSETPDGEPSNIIPNQVSNA